jgi:hypothetical protein
MNTEQQFVDLIKEGKVADAMQLIKTALTEMAGVSIVQTKFDVAEACGMKKSMKEEDDDMDMEDEEDEDDEMKEKKKGMEAEGKKMVDNIQKAPTMKEGYGKKKKSMKEEDMDMEDDEDEDDEMKEMKKMKK